MKHRVLFSVGSALAALALAWMVSGCAAALPPQLTYQGRLTDAAGNPANGTHRFTFKVYHVSSSGTAIYTETKSINVTNGLFDTVLGPTGAVGNLTPKDLAEPLYVEVTVGNGTYTETLSPRQRLYGAPYAFTLMPGAFISSTLDETTYGASLDAVLTIQNEFVTSGSNPPLPVLRLFGERALEVAGPGANDDGNIYSRLDGTNSDLFLHSNDEAWVFIDADQNSGSVFAVLTGTLSNNGGSLCSISEAGNLTCKGTKSAVVQVDEQPRLMYAVESPEVWFEDFGASALQNGAATVNIDPLFAKTVNLGVDYHVFLTPLGDSNGLYVAEKTATGFTVREMGGGTSDVGFDYRIVAKRAGYETTRLPVAPANDYADLEAKEEGR